MWQGQPGGKSSFAQSLEEKEADPDWIKAAKEFCGVPKEKPELRTGAEHIAFPRVLPKEPRNVTQYQMGK